MSMYLVVYHIFWQGQYIIFKWNNIKLLEEKKLKYYWDIVYSCVAILITKNLLMLKKHHDHVNYIFKDPENPDFSGVVDFSNAVPGPDGSWCITKVRHFYQEIQKTQILTAHL